MDSCSWHPSVAHPPPLRLPSTAQVAIRRHPLEGGLTPWTALSVTYLTLFAAYWLVALVRGVGAHNRDLLQLCAVQ